MISSCTLSMRSSTRFTCSDICVFTLLNVGLDGTLCPVNPQVLHVNHSCRSRCLTENVAEIRSFVNDGEIMYLPRTAPTHRPITDIIPVQT